MNRDGGDVAYRAAARAGDLVARDDADVDALVNALSVIVLDPLIRRYLLDHDQKALEQAELALGMRSNISRNSERAYTVAYQTQRTWVELTTLIILGEKHGLNVDAERAALAHLNRAMGKPEADKNVDTAITL